ncbi:MAG: response regulator transcription factor [Anaerolineales bacterium]
MKDNLILLVDDEQNIIDLASMYLNKEGFETISAQDGLHALDMAKRHKPALLVLDLMLPELDGWEVCKRLRANSDVPILMLTARDDDIDKIVGLELGADDYMTKPFNPRELVARVKAILRRSEPKIATADAPPPPVKVGDLHIDPARRTAQTAQGTVELRTKEFDLLLALAQNPGIVFSRDKLLSIVWGFDFAGETRTVDVHIAHLRHKLGGSQVMIETVWGVGYKLETR